jgi:hypothetical protein
MMLVRWVPTTERKPPAFEDRVVLFEALGMDIANWDPDEAAWVLPNNNFTVADCEPICWLEGLEKP